MRCQLGLELEQYVIHDIAYDLYPMGDALTMQVLACGLGWTEQTARHVICQHAVDLLRHLPVEAPQAGFNMDGWNVELHSGQRACECGVGVPKDNRAIRLLFHKHPLDCFEHSPRLG